MPENWSAQGRGSPVRWAAIVPVKPLAKAKTRLRVGSLRTPLALAFAQDTVHALVRSTRFGPVFVVTSDPAVRSALMTHDVVFLDERRGELGLNLVVARSLTTVRAIAGALPVAVVVADLPAAKPEQFSTVADRAAGHPRSIVSDGDQRGTTMLLLTDTGDFHPTYGADSRSAHLSAGCIELDSTGLDGVRRDVDTVEHLYAAVELGLGEHTRGQLVGAAYCGYS